MTFADLRNEGSYTFLDISSEVARKYTFLGKGDIIITNPIALAVSGSGHRILDNEGTSYFVPFGWEVLRWNVKEGKPHFVK
jgi:hypothetical protein